MRSQKVMSAGTENKKFLIWPNAQMKHAFTTDAMGTYSNWALSWLGLLAPAEMCQFCYAQTYQLLNGDC